MKYNHHLTGVTIIKDGDELGYPWKVSLRNLMKVCDTVEIAVGKSTDETFEKVLKIAQENDPQIRIHYREWDMHNTGDGRELAFRANEALSRANGDWVLYLQADELLHEDDHSTLREFIDRAPDHITQIELFRTYFWGNLKTRAPDFELPLGRVFRKGTHVVGGDGMHLVRFNGQVMRTNINIYHYSRMGTEEEVTRRLRNLDSLFHDKNVVDGFSPFSYNENTGLSEYTGSHPHGIKEFYKENS